MVIEPALRNISARAVLNTATHRIQSCTKQCLATNTVPYIYASHLSIGRKISNWTRSPILTQQTRYRYRSIRIRSYKTSLGAGHTTVINQQKSMTTLKSLTSEARAGDYTQQNFDYFLVLDFEATCDNKQRLNPQEIIEFPVLKVNAKTGQVDSVFHQYVSPQFHPHLTPFCTELTGIIQDMVTGQPHLPDVLQSFNQWMLQEGLLEPDCHKIFVTCGDWDLKTMLPRQCAVLHLTPQNYFNRWINIKKSFADVTGTFPKGMMYMLQALDLKHEGRHHSGIDDCRNIAKILVKMLTLRYVFKENGKLR